MTPIVFLDTETDGVHPGRKAWEVAMIRRDDAGQRETQFFVEIDLQTADPFGLKVGRFYDRHPLGRYLSGLDSALGTSALSPTHAAMRVARWTHGAHIVGAVPNFDTEVAATLVRAEYLTPAWHYHLIDVENLAAGWLHGQADGLEAAAAGIGAEPPDVAVLIEDARRIRADARPPYDSDKLSRACGVEPPGDDERHTAMGDARWAMRLYDKITGGAPE